jgi:hypothetical protein
MTPLKRSQPARTSRPAHGLAVRPPFRNPRLFLEVPLLNKSGLLELAERCGMKLPPTLLSWYMAEGFLLPVAVRRGRPLFARWQLWTLHELEEARYHSVHVFAHAPLEDQDNRSWRNQVAAEAPYFLSSGEYFQVWLELVILL